MTQGNTYDVSAAAAELLRSIPAVREQYSRSAPGMKDRLTTDEFYVWGEHILRISQAAPRAWEASVEFMRASVAVYDAMGFRHVQEWAEGGRQLAGLAADMAGAYFRAGPSCLTRLPEGGIPRFAALGVTMYRGNWRSSAVVTRFYDLGTQIISNVGFEDVEALAHLIAHLQERSYSVAQESVGTVAAVLPRVDRLHQRGVINVARALAQHSENATSVFLEQTLRVLARVERQEQQKFLNIAERAAWLNAQVGSGILLEGSAAIDKAPRNAHARILDRAEDLLMYTPWAAMEFLKSIPKILERLRPEDIDDWVYEGIAVLKINEAGGLAFFKLEAVGAEELLKTLSRGVELSRVGDVLRLYAKALSGVDVHIQPTENITRKGIGWTSEKKPTTEGTNIFLPPFIQEYESQPENFTCLKVYATHQVGHLEFDSFRFRFETEGALFPSLRSGVEEMVGGIKGHPMTDMERFFDIFPLRRLAGDLFTLAEDVRVDSRLSREYAGIRPGIRRIQQDTRERRPSLRGQPLRVALIEGWLQQTLDPRLPVELPQRIHKHFLAGLAYLRDLMHPEAVVEDAAEATLRLYGLVIGVPNLPADRIDPASWQPVDVKQIDNQDAGEVLRLLFGVSDSSTKDIGGMMLQPEAEGGVAYEGLADVDFRGDFKPELVQTIMRLKLTDKDSGRPLAPLSPEEMKALFEKLAEAEISEMLAADVDQSSGLFVNNIMREAGQEATKRAGGQTTRGPKGDLEGDEMEALEPATFTYDEWDFRAGDYRPNWCLLVEKTVEEGSEEYYEETLRKHSKLADQVRRQFEMLKPELFKKIKNLTDGEEYDLDKVIEAHVERRARLTPSEKVYWRRNKEERSVAMAFLLDMSASTEEDIDKERARREEEESWVAFDDDDPRGYLTLMMQREEKRKEKKKQRHRIIDVEKESAVLLIQALETVGDTYGVYGFSGYGRDNVEFFTIKDLKEDFGEAVKRRIEKIEPVRGTRMGPAIRHAIAKLDAHDARIKVLILLSDGRPQDHNYGRDRTEKDYAIHDTKMALLEAKRKNIIPFCLTVDQEGHDYLKAMCEDMGYEVVQDIQGLPGRLPTLYRMLTV